LIAPLPMLVPLIIGSGCHATPVAFVLVAIF
jgi:hypothetical protein